MQNQDNDKEHAWELTYADHSNPYKIIKYEQCMKCNAARVTEFPSGDLIGIETAGSSPIFCSRPSNKT